MSKDAKRVALPVVGQSCPPQPCIRACRANVLIDVTAAGSIAIAGGPTIAQLRSNRRKVTEADVDEAAAVLASRARALGNTCMWWWADRAASRGGMTQAQVARVLGVERQRVDQIEQPALAVVGSLLLSAGIAA